MQENGDVVKLLSQMLGKFDELTSEVKYLRKDTNERFSEVNSRLDGMNNRFDGTNNRLEGMNNRLDNLTQEVDNLTMELNSSFNTLYGAAMKTNEEIRHLDDALHEIISILSKDVVFFGLPVVLETPGQQYSGIIRKPK
jgi:uncharacterized coiled-coil DUF342 family protein